MPKIKGTSKSDSIRESGGNGAIQKGDPGNRGQGRGAGHGGILRPLDLPRILEPPQRGRAKRGCKFCGFGLRTASHEIRCVVGVELKQILDEDFRKQKEEFMKQFAQDMKELKIAIQKKLEAKKKRKQEQEQEQQLSNI